jgi:hypothetical protein
MVIILQREWFMVQGMKEAHSHPSPLLIKRV